MRIVSSPSFDSVLRVRPALAVLALLIVFGLVPQAHAAPCTQSTVDPSVTICSPANGATVTSPVPIVAGTNSSSAVAYMQIYVDGVKVYEVSASQLSTSVPMSVGSHRVTVQAKNAAGTIFKQTIYVTVSSGSGGGGGGTGDLSSLKHIIFMLQENRSADNYFGQLGVYRQNLGLVDTYDGIPAGAKGLTKSGQYVPAYHYQTVCTENLSPGWNESHYDLDGGKMDRFPYTTAGSVPSTIDPQGTRAMGYYDWNDLPFYYDLATQFATSDRFFSSVLAPTIPNRMYMFTGTSFGHIRPDATPTGGWTQKTIFEALDAAGVSWRYYYQDSSVFLADFSIWGKDQGKVYSISKYYTDIQTPSTLPSVIFIERGSSTAGTDEHPTKNVQKGSAVVKQIVDALLSSPTWASSAFILTFDEGGGLYDHVVPASVPLPDTIAPMLRSTDIKATFNQTGFRVPFILLSPWAKPHYVSHTAMEFGSILRLIEKRFNVPALTARDANAPDMTEFFDFTNAQWLTPPVTKFQQTDGLCSQNAEKAPGW